MKTKTSNLIGPALDWAVAKCEGLDLFQTEGWVYMDGIRAVFRPSTDWSQGGPIIERERMFPQENWGPGHDGERAFYCINSKVYYVGPTPLVAAMRCYVASKLGDDIDIPEELQ